MWSHRSHDPDKLVTIAQADFQFASLVMMESDGENDRNSRDNRNTLDNFSHESHVANSNDYDVEGSSTRNSATRGSRSSPQIKPEPSWLWTFNGRETVDLISDNDETKIKQEDVVDLTFDWVKMADDCIVLSDSEDDIETVPQVDYPSRNAHSGQIQEDASRVTHEDDLIALSRDNPGSREASSIFGNGTKPAKLGSFILQTPTTRPELTPAKRAEMIRRQQQLGVIFRNQGRIADGNAFGGFAEASSSRSATSGSSMAAENAGTFTDTESALDAEAVGRWKNAKQVYKRMKDQGTNYFEDDVIWGKAKKAENLRRQQAGVFSRAGSVSSDDEARETSESLFVPQGQPDQGRAAEDATAPDKEPSIPDILQADEAEENLVYDVFGAETTRPNLHGAKRSRQQDRDESMHTGMEALLSHESRKAAKEKKTRKRKAPNESTEKVKKPRTKKDTKGKGKTKEKATSKVAKGKRRATQSQSGPPLNAASSLLYNDVRRLS